MRCVSSGLGKLSQGISTALAVEKTSKRGGKIVNVAAEIGKEPREVLWLVIGSLSVTMQRYSWSKRKRKHRVSLKS